MVDCVTHCPRAARYLHGDAHIHASQWDHLMRPYEQYASQSCRPILLPWRFQIVQPWIQRSSMYDLSNVIVEMEKSV